MRTYWLEDEDVTIREKRARNSDDSGVNTDGPTDLSQTNAILMHKQRALQHHQQQQLQLQFGRPDSGNTLRSSFGLSFKQHRRSAGDSRSLTGLIGALSGGAGGADGCASPGGSSTGGSMFPRRSRSARGYRHNRSDAETMSSVTARSVSQTFGSRLGSQLAVNSSYSIADETSRHPKAPAPGIPAAVLATTTASLMPVNITSSARVTLQVPDLLTRTPEADARENLEKRAASEMPSRLQNASTTSSVFASSPHGEHGKKGTAGSSANGLLGGAPLRGHEYSGHPAVKTGLWVDKHAEFHRHNTEPVLPRARNRAALYATTACTIKAANTTSTTITDSVLASCKTCNSGRSLGKKKHKCNHHNSLATGNHGAVDNSAGRTFSTHSPACKRRETAPEIPVSETIRPEKISNLYLSLHSPSESPTETTEDKSPKEESAKAKDRTFNLHIFNPKKGKPKDKQFNFSGAPYESEIPEGVVGSFTPSRTSPDGRIPGSQKNRVHPLLMAGQGDITCGAQMEDCPSPSRHSVTFSEDTGM